jgi:Ig-fold domain
MREVSQVQHLAAGWKVHDFAPMDVEAAGPSEARVTLRAPADHYVYFAHLTSPSESTHFSDNYFDLEPGENREVRLTDSAHELAPDRLGLGWA